jgi:hypothetical protein
MSKIIPVIHTVNLEQVQYNVNLCQANGINDVFIISHKVRDWKKAVYDFQTYLNWIRTTYPEMKVGVNFLQLDTLPAVLESNTLGFDYLWADTSYLQSKSTLHIAEKIAEIKQTTYFGCVAFKYQKPEEDLEWSCSKAKELMDIVVTSGDGTSYAPAIEKIKTIKSFIGDKPLAIASGITPENKSMYQDLVDCFMVASSITDKYENIIESRLKDLINK